MKIILFIIVLLFSASCQSVKDGLTMQKKNNSDEFLIEKKNPLVVPPEYGNLPKPQETDDNIKEDSANVVRSLLDDDKVREIDKKDKPTNLESLILNEIKSE